MPHYEDRLESSSVHGRLAPIWNAGAYECPHPCKCVETSGQCQDFGESQRQPLDSTTLGLPLNVSRRVQNTTLEENKASNLTNGCKNGEDCQHKEFEAVSYVFLGIVLALIGVVFLMVLYLNRRGIKRWLNNIREACRDQMEVYHYRYEQDSDPRLANVAV